MSLTLRLLMVFMRFLSDESDSLSPFLDNIKFFST